MAATSLHNDVLLNPEERHERASHCAYANGDSFVGSAASGRGCEMANKHIVLSGVPRMVAMEELSALCGQF